MSDAIPTEAETGRALREWGADPAAREAILELLRKTQAGHADPDRFARDVRWPLVKALLGAEGAHRIVLENGLVFELRTDSRVDKAALLGLEERPDHVWEPQTTRLLTMLAAGARHVIIGGAYVGDQALPVALTLAATDPAGVVHAFEPMASTHDRLLRNIALNRLDNILPHRAALWDEDGVRLVVEGEQALAGAVPVAGLGRAATAPAGSVESITIDSYLRERSIDAVQVIMLDTEGGEERALRGALGQLDRPFPQAPAVVFEIHRDHVDWTVGLERTPIVRLLAERGYRVFAIRDFQSNRDMRGSPIEVVPVDRVWLEGPPHGFNLFASKNPSAVDDLGLVIVPDVSPKYLVHKDPALHHPRGGFPSRSCGERP